LLLIILLGRDAAELSHALLASVLHPNSASACLLYATGTTTTTTSSSSSSQRRLAC
jgi:hypothetical protein